MGVESVIYGNLTDSPHNVINHSGLLDEQFTPKEAYRILCRLRETIHGTKDGTTITVES